MEGRGVAMLNTQSRKPRVSNIIALMTTEFVRVLSACIIIRYEKFQKVDEYPRGHAHGSFNGGTSSAT